MFKLKEIIEGVDVRFEVFDGGFVCRHQDLEYEDFVSSKELFLHNTSEIINIGVVPYTMGVTVGDRLYIGSVNGKLLILNDKGERILIDDTGDCSVGFGRILGDNIISEEYLLKMTSQKIYHHKATDLEIGTIKKVELVDKDLNVKFLLNSLTTSIFDEENLKCEVNQYFYNFLINDKLLTLSTRLCLAAYDIKTGGVHWEFNFESQENKGRYVKHYLQNILGIYMNELYVICSMGNILVIDLHTGKQIHRWEGIGNCFLDKVRGRILAFKFDKERGKALGLKWSVYQRVEIYLNTKDVYSTDIFDYFSELDIKNLEINWDSPIIGDHLICIFRTLNVQDDWNWGIKSGLLSYNLQTNMVDWQYFVEEGSLALIPKVSNNKIYVGDGNLSQIMIFEKINT